MIDLFGDEPAEAEAPPPKSSLGRSSMVGGSSLGRSSMVGGSSVVGGPLPSGSASRPPLSTRMRPQTLDDFAGQRQVVGEGTALRRALTNDQLPSMILWGPPGSGKTTLAGIIANTTGAGFESLSATLAGVADLRRVMDRALERARAGQRTLLFIDEIHRFNKGQQDTVLPHVESGLIRLVGATTENPGFEVNAALLSRARVVRLEALDEGAVRAIIQRAIRDPECGLGMRAIVLESAAEDRLVALAGGDARVALDVLEMAAVDDLITVAAVEGAMQRPPVRHDLVGDRHYWVASAFIKSMRGSDPDASVYWLARLLEAGEDPVFVARRMVILAAEDVGLADPVALQVAMAAQQAAHLIGMPEASLPLSEAALYLALAPKSNSAYLAYQAARADVHAILDAEVPLHLRNPTSRPGRELGFGAGYRYAHDYENALVAQQYLPDGLAGQRYYVANDRGAEAAMKARLDHARGVLVGGRGPGDLGSAGDPDGLGPGGLGSPGDLGGHEGAGDRDGTITAE